MAPIVSRKRSAVPSPCTNRQQDHNSFLFLRMCHHFRLLLAVFLASFSGVPRESLKDRSHRFLLSPRGPIFSLSRKFWYPPGPENIRTSALVGGGLATRPHCISFFANTKSRAFAKQFFALPQGNNVTGGLAATRPHCKSFSHCQGTSEQESM